MLKKDKTVPITGLMEAYLVFASPEKSVHILLLVFFILLPLSDVITRPIVL